MATIGPKERAAGAHKVESQVEPKAGMNRLDRLATEEFERTYSKVATHLEDRTGMRIPDKERLRVTLEENMGRSHNAAGTYSKDHEMQLDIERFRDLVVIKHITDDPSKSEKVRKDAASEYAQKSKEAERIIAHELAHVIRRETMFRRGGENIVAPPAEEALANFVSAVAVGMNEQELTRAIYSDMLHARPLMEGTAKEKDAKYGKEPGHFSPENLSMQDYKGDARAAPGYVIGSMAALAVHHSDEATKTDLIRELMAEENPTKLFSRLMELANARNPSSHVLNQSQEMMHGYVNNFKDFEHLMNKLNSAK